MKFNITKTIVLYLLHINVCECFPITCLSLPFAEKQTTCHFDCKRLFKLSTGKMILKFYKSVNLKNAWMKLFGCTYLMHIESHYLSLNVNMFYIPKVSMQRLTNAWNRIFRSILKVCVNYTNDWWTFLCMLVVYRCWLTLV